MCLLLAVNIFPLIWAIRLSFTGFMANLPMPIRFTGIDNYVDILTDEDIWLHFQVTAHFVLWTIALEVIIGLGLALLINQKFRGHSFWTTVILLPMMLSPAVVGNFWTLQLQPQIGPFNYLIGFFTGIAPSSFTMIGSVDLAPWTIVSAATTSHSVTESSPLLRWIAAAVVTLYAIVTILPLAWIVATAFKSQEDAIAYPPKVFFTPTLEGFVDLFTVQTHQSHDFITKLPPPQSWYEKLARDRDMVIAGPSRVVERFVNSLIIGFGSTLLATLLGTLAAYGFSTICCFSSSRHA